MQTPSPRSSVAIFAAAVLGAAVILSSQGWPGPGRGLEFSALLLAAILASIFEVRPSAGDRETMRPSFVIGFATLVLFGLPAAMFVAAAAEVGYGLARAASLRGAGGMIAKVVAVLFAMQAAGAVHLALGGTIGHFVWPWQVLPLGAAVVAYCTALGTVPGFVVPLAMRQRIESSWPIRAIRVCPPYIVGASLAVGLAEVVAHGFWELLPVAALPLYVAYRAYCSHLDRVHEEHRRGEVIDALVQGMSVLNGSGEVTVWSDALERLLGCPRGSAVGRSLVGAVPALARTELARAVDDVLRTRQPRTVDRVGVSGPAGARILEVRILPVDGGATLLWHDVTGRKREDGVKRAEERLALAVEAANDGLWEWDLESQECFFSGRWRAMVGLPAEAGSGSSEEWLGRVHPEDVASLTEAIDAHLSAKTDRLQHEHRLRHEDGTYRWFMCRGVAAPGAGRRPGRIAGSLTERPEGAHGRDRLGSAGFVDPLTGLANRTVFVERLGRRLAEAKERGGNRFAVLYLDLDRFKVVNDSLGHLVGDELLSAVSRRLEACLRPTDVLARLGGDEFAILLNNLGDEQQANAVAFRIQESLSASFSIGGREVFTTASIGIAIGTMQYAGPDELMRDADTAMYHAKTRGKARHELFDADMHARVRDRLGLENDLRHAVARGDFEVHYQPIVSLGSGMCVGFESLIRWKRNGEPVSPDKFIPLAEELGLIESLGTWVLSQACHAFADWQKRYSGSLEYITVNVSSRQLVQQNFLGVVEKAVRDAGLKPSDLRLEITETALMDSPKAVAGLLRDLRDFGVKIYLDDFGTGYSSLSHLHKLPVDALKIDRSFVRSLLLVDRPAIVESILALARTLNTSVVAEGIETDAQALELERLGCTHAQGYLFSRPLPVTAAEQLLAANQPLGPKKPPLARAAASGEREAYSPFGRFAWPDSVQARREPTVRPMPRLVRS